MNQNEVSTPLEVQSPDTQARRRAAIESGALNSFTILRGRAMEGAKIIGEALRLIDGHSPQASTSFAELDAKLRALGEQTQQQLVDAEQNHPDDPSLDTQLPRSARMTLKEWGDATVIDKVKHRIAALDPDPVRAARLLLKAIPKEIKYSSHREILALITPHMTHIAKIAMENPILHRQLSRVIFESYGSELLHVVLQQVHEGGPMPPNVELQLLGDMKTVIAKGITGIDEERRAILTEHMSTIVAVALRNPQFHKKLINMVVDGYRKLPKHEDSAKHLIKMLTGQVMSQTMEGLNEIAGVFEFAAKLPKSLPYWRRNDFNSDKFPANLWLDLYDTFSEKRDKVGEFLDAKGINQEVLESHVSSGYDEMRSVMAIIRLEHMYPGMCSRLQANFGINSFHRYSPDFLANLDKNEEGINVSKRVLIVVASDDNNGAFANQSEYKRYLKLKKFGIEPLLLEVNSLEELATLVKQRDPAILKTISQVMISAHGESDNLHLGYDNGERLYIRESNLSQLKEIFKHMPNVQDIILNSCSTGKEKREGGEVTASIARIMRDNLGITVEAPRIDTSARKKVGRKGIKFKPYFYFTLGFGSRGIQVRGPSHFAKVRYPGNKKDGS